MPNRNIFSPLEREQLDRFPDEISADDLNTYFRLSLADLFAVRDLRGPTNQFGFALQIATLRFLGFCPDNLTTAPLMLRLFLAQQLGIQLADLEEYGEREQTRTEHFKRAAQHLGFRNIKEEDSQTLLQWLQERALEHDEPRLLFEMLLQKIKIDKFVRPGVSVVERWVLSARDKAQQQTYVLLNPLFTQERLAWLDKLVVKDEAIGHTPLEWLRFKPFTNSPDSILTAIKKLDFLKAAKVAEWDLQALNPNRRKFLAEIAKHTSAQALATATASRKYPILTAFVCESLVAITDLTVEMFDAYLAGVYSRAGFELREFRLSIAPTANEQMHILRQMSTMVLDEKVADAELRQAIYEQLPPTKLQQVVEICERLTRPLDDNYFDLLASRYSHIREFAPKLLEILAFQANTATKPLLEAIELLRELNREHKRQVPGTAPVEFVNSKWEPYVYNANGTLNRKYYELCVLWELRGAIRGSNIWVEGSRRYAPLTSFLIETTRWQDSKTEVYELLSLPQNGAERLQELEHQIVTNLQRVEKFLASNAPARPW